MVELSDEVLLEVFGHLDIDSFFTIRLLNRHIYSLTSNHLGSVTKAVAETTFPTQKRVLRRKDGERADITWLNELRHRKSSDPIE